MNKEMRGIASERTEPDSPPPPRPAVAPVCPLCGSAEFRSIKCRIHCLNCGTLVENCNGD